MAGVTGTKSESARAITPSKMAETKIKKKITCTSSYRKKTVCKISNQSDERCGRSCGDKVSEGRADGKRDRQGLFL